MLPDHIFATLVRERDLYILVSASRRGLGEMRVDEIDPGAHGSAVYRMRSLETGDYVNSWKIRLGRVCWELAPPPAFNGIVIHECCHVYLGAEGDDGTDGDDDIQRREDEAVAMACEIGFRQETAEYLNFFAHTFGEAGIMGRLTPTVAP